MANQNLDRALSPEYLAGLDSWPVEELRERRGECQRLEDAASYLRRLVQVRLDIIALVTRNRVHDDATDPAALERLVRELPGALAEESGSRTAGGRLVASGLGDDQERWAEARVAAAGGGVSVDRTMELPLADLERLRDQLDALEQQVSGERRRLHDVLDRLQKELVQRYKTGSASVEGLLR